MQEEPRNMGAWKVMSRRMPDLLPEGVELTYIGRRGAPARARATPGPTRASRSGSSSPRSPRRLARADRASPCRGGCSSG